MPIITAQSPLPTAAPVEAIKQSVVQPTPMPEAKAEVAEQMDPKFAALARKERANRAEALKLKAEKDSWLAEKAKYESDYIPRAKLSEIARNNPLGFLEQGGLTPDEFTQALLNSSPEKHDIIKLNAKIAELEGRLSQTSTKIDERETQAYEQAVNQIRSDVKIFVSAEPDYEMIRETNSAEAVVELIKEHFNTSGTILSIDEAAKQVEDYLTEEAMKMARLKKVQQKLTPPQAEATKPQIQKQPIKTITHAMNSPNAKASEKERISRALAAFKGQLT